MSLSGALCGYGTRRGGCGCHVELFARRASIRGQSYPAHNLKTKAEYVQQFEHSCSGIYRYQCVSNANPSRPCPRFTYLDTSGRPVLVLRRANVAVPELAAKFSVEYSFGAVHTLREPLLLVRMRVCCGGKGRQGNGRCWDHSIPWRVGR